MANPNIQRLFPADEAREIEGLMTQTHHQLVDDAAKQVKVLVARHEAKARGRVAAIAETCRLYRDVSLVGGLSGAAIGIATGNLALAAVGGIFGASGTSIFGRKAQQLESVNSTPLTPQVAVLREGLEVLQARQAALQIAQEPAFEQPQLTA